MSCDTYLSWPSLLMLGALDSGCNGFCGNALSLDNALALAFGWCIISTSSITTALDPAKSALTNT